MKEALALIRKQWTLTAALTADLTELKECLKGKISGKSVTDSAEKIDTTLKELAELNKAQERFLAKAGGDTMADFVQAQPASEDRDVALRLLFQLEEAVWQLKDALGLNKDLLENARDFAAYHMNVLSQTVAGNTYGPPGNQGNETVQGRKMFEANA
ncbi:MAG: flagellar export chaperone FlgN [Selenomonadaceae bacterium]|nr:flagellar export chaperone FlgN [Selenomonadaceae bacterium]